MPGLPQSGREPVSTDWNSRLFQNGLNVLSGREGYVDGARIAASSGRHGDEQNWPV